MFVTQILNKNIQETAKYPNEITLEITKDGWFKQRFIKNKHTDYYKHFSKMIQYMYMIAITFISFQNLERPIVTVCAR